MADQIYHHVERVNDGRSSLLIVGYAHATRNLANIANMPYKSVVWHLMNSMGNENLYSIFPHSVRMNNWGKTDGRLCLGLFDNAFELFGRRQFAFPLKDSPFGAERFDADLDSPTLKSYQDVFDAYLYLGKLDYELRSPLIAGFYSDGFAEEVDRRYDGWLQRYGMQEINEKNLQSLMLSGRINGRFYNLLGPINAWQLGDSWKDTHILRAFNNLVDNPQQPEKDLTVVFDFLNQAHRMDSLAFVYSAELISNKLRDLTFKAHLYSLFKNHVIKDVLIEPQDNFLDNAKTNILKVKYSIVLDSKGTIQDEVELEYNVFSGKWEFKDFDWILRIEGKL